MGYFNIAAGFTSSDTFWGARMPSIESLSYRADVVGNKALNTAEAACWTNVVGKSTLLSIELCIFTKNRVQQVLFFQLFDINATVAPN
ncbi:hypothetical protein C173_00180 [Paenibacillus sp. FSL R7-277]|nr:hypothetical protein C173_00180 [Paenibacillus sp. FSL R7-277]